MARPSKYETEVKGKLFLVECWARDGLTEEQIANNLGIAYSTLKVYKNEHSALMAALKRGKEVVDFEVENALLKKAMDGDTTAQIFWLKNRKPKEWRDRRDYNVEANVVKEELSPEERVERIKKLKEKLNDK